MNQTASTFEAIYGSVFPRPGGAYRCVACGHRWPELPDAHRCDDGQSSPLPPYDNTRPADDRERYDWNDLFTNRDDRAVTAADRETYDWNDLLAGRNETPRTPAAAAQPLTQASLGGLLRTVAETGEGKRNDVLYWAAKRAVEAGHTDRGIADALTEAALHAGLDRRGIAGTLRSAGFKP